VTQNEEESKFDETDDTKVVKEGIYIRVSDDKQVHDRQIVLMSTYQKGRRPNHMTEGKYLEKASARGKKARPKFDEMMADLKSNRIQRIVASSMDRFVRSSQDFHKAIATIKKSNGELHLIKENLTINNTNTPYQNLMATVFAAFAEFESDLISERTHEGMAVTKKLNPFVRYGQPPKIKGRSVGQVIKMYYSQTRRTRAYDQRTKGPKFTYTLQDISDRMGVTKGGLSQWIDARVTIGIMKLRQPQKAYEMAMDDVEGLEEPERRTHYDAHIKAGEERMKQRVLAPVMWTDEIRMKVSKKFGHGYSNKGNANAIKAFKYGTSLYVKWLNKLVAKSQTGGLIGGLKPVDIVKEYEMSIDSPTIKALSDEE